MSTQSISIIPQPHTLNVGDGTFRLDQSAAIHHDSQCAGAAAYASQLLDVPITQEGGSISMSVDPTVSTAEGYRLSVRQNSISIVGNDESGVFYGIQTLRQLLPAEMFDGRNADVDIPVLTVEDAPRFRWRGMHLDVCRHMFPVEFVKRYIDLLASHKYNIFHWHLTEDQGWRIEIKKYPRLSEVSAWREATPLPENRHELDGKPYGGIYTQDEVREVVAYAAERFVTVVPEIELPGHTIAVLAAYPDLGCTGENYKVRTSWGIEDDVFCAGNDDVFTFLEDVLTEVFELFPSDFIHIGGDECPKVRWKECPSCQARMRQEDLANEEELQSYFVTRIGRFIQENGRRMIGWDEILEGGLAPNAAVMSWRGTQGGITAAKDGHEVVMSPITHCYFDYYQTPDRENEPPAFWWPIPEEHRTPDGPEFVGLIPLEQVYTFDPTDGVPAEFHKFVLGGQANLWTEYIPTTQQAEYQSYPRAVALSETLWSPAPESGERDLDGFLGRLRLHLQRLDTMGVNYRYPKELLD